MGSKSVSSPPSPPPAGAFPPPPPPPPPPPSSATDSYDGDVGRSDLIVQRDDPRTASGDGQDHHLLSVRLRLEIDPLEIEYAPKGWQYAVDISGGFCPGGGEIAWSGGPMDAAASSSSSPSKTGCDCSRRMSSKMNPEIAELPVEERWITVTFPEDFRGIADVVVRAGWAAGHETVKVTEVGLGGVFGGVDDANELGGVEELESESESESESELESEEPEEGSADDGGAEFTQEERKNPPPKKPEEPSSEGRPGRREALKRQRNIRQQDFSDADADADAADADAADADADAIGDDLVDIKFSLKRFYLVCLAIVGTVVGSVYVKITGICWRNSRMGHRKYR